MGKRKRKAAALELDTASRHDFAPGGVLGHDSAEYAISVGERTALGVDVVFACVTRLADALSSGDVGEWHGTERLDPSPLVRRPYHGLTQREWVWVNVATLALYTTAYLRKVGTRWDLTPLDLEPIAPFRLSKIGGKLMLDGRTELDPADLIPMRRAVWPSLSSEAGTLLRLAREAFAAAWAQGAYAADFWENGGAPMVQITSDQALTNTDADTIRDRYTETRRDNPGAPLVMGKGASAKPFGLDLASSGIGEAGDRTLASIARYFGMQPWLVNVPSAAGSLTYQNAEAAGMDLVRYTLPSYRGALQDAWSEALPGDYLTGRVVRIDLSHLTAGTLLERAQAYQLAADPETGWMTKAEIRTREALPPDNGLDPRGAPAPAIELIPEG